MRNFISIFILFFLLISNVHASEIAEHTLPYQTGVVENVEYLDNPSDEFVKTKQIVDIKLSGGKLNGLKIKTENVNTGNPFYDFNLQKGVKVILQPEISSDGISYPISDIKRTDALFLLTAIFCILLCLIGRLKGLYSLFAIGITCFLILKILVPLVLNGVNPIVCTMGVCIISTVLTMYAVGGFNRKSTAASVSCLLSIIVAGILSYFTVHYAHLTGFADEIAMYLFSTHPELDFIAILISAILLATLGAVMDIAMSVASTINEIYTLDNTKTKYELFKSGMNVGRDIIGTMANTLLLVYLGGALPLFLLTSQLDLYKFINLNSVVTEISSALIGSSAIVICVPITAFVTSFLLSVCNKKFENPLKSTFDEEE